MAQQVGYKEADHVGPWQETIASCHAKAQALADEVEAGGPAPDVSAEEWEAMKAGAVEMRRVVEWCELVLSTGHQSLVEEVILCSERAKGYFRTAADLAQTRKDRHE